MTKVPDLQRFIEFQQLLYKFQAVKRTVHYPPDGKLAENDVEHSYGLAMTAWFLADDFPHLDRNKLIKIALVHDLVEVHAGDTFVYGHKHHLDSKKEREAAALAQLKTEWPDFPDMFEAIEEYKHLSSEEGKFVYALDKILPTIMVYLGEGYLWHEYGVTYEDFLKEKEHKVKHSPEIDAYFKQIRKLLEDKPQLFPKK